MKRKILKTIYDLLPNAEKTAWGINANYTGYQGLYRYLKDNGEEEAFRRVVDGLKITVGESRFNVLIAQASQNNTSQSANINTPACSQFEDELRRIKIQVTSNISSFSDVNELRNLETTLEHVVALIRNQRERLELFDAINN